MTESLKIFRRSAMDGLNYQASYVDHYHALGWTPDLAVLRLASYLSDEFPEVWQRAKPEFDNYFH